VQGLARAQAEDSDPLGTSALLGLLRCRLAESLPRSTPPIAITEHDITKALLAYRRYGLVGLGESTLAAYLLPQSSNMLQRGEHTHARLIEYLHEVMQLGASESLLILQQELQRPAAPAEQRAELGLSKSEYYRRRREAMSALLALLTSERG
jgi:hypothetical protein